ncbi:MAG: metallophosphoesterase, partial [Actinobacteria bacterium]|nr:metallophosphoesterase [Actinomycetota bacterium]
LQRFVGLWDLHYGYERKGGHKTPLHDTKALGIALDFIRDFKPDHVILGGDILDCGSVSHHNHGKPGATEGLKLLTDATELKAKLIDPIDKLVPRAKKVYIVGNHEDWLNDLEQQIPALEGIINVQSLLKLNKTWNVVPQGEAYKLGKLVFVHGDQIKGGVHAAKWAVDTFGRNIFFGHIHTHQSYTKVSALDLHGHTGTAVPCLCKKNPNYGGGSPNRWQQGFLYGYQDETSFNAYVVTIVDGRAFVNGKLYRATS